VVGETYHAFVFLVIFSSTLRCNTNTSTTLINNGTDLVSTIPTSVTLTTTGAFTLTNDAGPLNVELNLNFANTSDTIYVGGVRLTLGHQD
jgi:hypothetical protein